MTDEELIDLAKRYATTELGINPTMLTGGRVTEAAVVYFGNNTDSRVEMVLNKETGGLISAAVTPSLNSNR
jgi:hypothetical protein